MKKSIAKNYIYNTIYQIFLLIVPLITTPYISRVLGAEGIGQYSFTFSLINYFVLFGNLGFGYYAQREIAKYQSDKTKQSLIFWEIIILRSITIGSCIAINICIAVFGGYGRYTYLMLMWTLYLISQLLDITFFFQGNEEFVKLVVRNIIVKLVSILSIFAFVREKNDVIIYIIIFSVSVLLGNFMLLFDLKKRIVPIKLNELRLKRHIVPTLILFIPTIATSIYTILDKTLIGTLIPDTYTIIENGNSLVIKVSDLENGYYEQAEKIVKLCLSVIGALGAVMIPRNANLFAEGKTRELNENIQLATNFVNLIGMPMCVGLIVIAPNLIPWFLGDEYVNSIAIMQVLAFIVLFIGYSGVMGTQYLVPTHQDRRFSISISIGAVVNLGLNLLLIPMWKAKGAAIASVLAEASIAIIMYIMIRKELNVLRMILHGWRYMLSAGIMGVIIWFIQNHMSANIFNTLILTCIGAVIYCFLLLVMKDPFLKFVFNKIKNR